MTTPTELFIAKQRIKELEAGIDEAISREEIAAAALRTAELEVGRLTAELRESQRRHREAVDTAVRWSHRISRLEGAAVFATTRARQGHNDGWASLARVLDDREV